MARQAGELDAQVLERSERASLPRHHLQAILSSGGGSEVWWPDGAAGLVEHARGLLSGQAALSVRFVMHDPAEWAPRGEVRLGIGYGWCEIAETEVGDEVDVLGEGERAGKPGTIVDADPGDAETLGARRQPKVLDRQTRGVDG